MMFALIEGGTLKKSELSYNQSIIRNGYRVDYTYLIDFQMGTLKLV